MKSILEDLDDAQYYGSDHDERDRKSSNKGGVPEETVEEELARLVSAVLDTHAVVGNDMECCPLEF